MITDASSKKSPLMFEETLRSSNAFKLIAGDFKLGPGHAYTIVSPDDGAVAEFFSLVGCLMFCETKSACMECSECKKVLHGNHPDVFNVNLAGERIKVQEIKDIVTSADIMPLSGRKAYFIHRADLMAADAQNKLLKTLEEPPKGVSIFLGASNETALLDTVKSRCRVIHMDVFGRQTGFDAIKAFGCSDEAAALAAECSEGELGRAAKIAVSSEYAEVYKTVLCVLSSLKRSSDILKLDGLAVLEKNAGEFLKVMSVVLRDILILKAGKEVFSGLERGTVEEIAKDFSLKAAAESIMIVNRAQKKLFYNVNALQVIDDLMFSILEAKYKFR